MKPKLAQNLKQILKEKDMTVAQLSRATKVPAQTLNNWLAGLEPRSMTQVKIVADYFNLSIDLLAYSVPLKIQTNPLKEHQDEIFAGVFEVVLRKKRES
jgi:transcriptional regulator with XRE-family HTH domain